MHEELREWDKPLLEMFVKKLDKLNIEEVASKLEEGGITLCSGRSYDWVIWLVASIDKESKCIDISLWKGAETDHGISDERLEGIIVETTNLKEAIEAAKDLLRELIEERLPEAPTHYLEEE